MCKCDDEDRRCERVEKDETLSFLYAVAWLCSECVMGWMGYDDDDEAKSRYFVHCIYSHETTDFRENAFKTDFLS